jgi:hypothetical protein
MAGSSVRPEDLKPHVDSQTCGRCRKPIESGHRVVMAYIVERPGLNLNNMAQLGLYLHEEFEFVHADCHNPFLVKGLRNG